MAFVLGSTVGGIHSPCGSLGKIINKKAGKNLLENKFRLLRVEMDQTYGILQAVNGHLNAPAHGAELSQSRYREPLVVQVGDESFSFAAGDLRPDDMEG